MWFIKASPAYYSSGKAHNKKYTYTAIKALDLKASLT